MSKKVSSLAVDIKRVKSAAADRGITLSKISEEMGYNLYYFSGLCNKGMIPKSIMVFLEKTYGITYDMIRPEEKKPELKPEPKTEPKPEPEQVQLQVMQAPQDAPQAADLSRLEEMLQEALHKLEKANEFNEQIKGGFRVRTSTQLMSQDIEAGVRDALKSH